MRNQNILLLLLCLYSTLIFSKEIKPLQEDENILDYKIENQILEYMNSGNIPGLSLVLVKGNQYQIKSFGYADVDNGKYVTRTTRFELGSCSKAFTGLAFTKLVEEGKIDIDKNVSDYLPWFKVFYKDKSVKVTLKQVVHHTSGIPWQTISKIPITSDSKALQKTVKRLINQKLDALPGEEFQYATINYDILALVIQKVAKVPFEKYVEEHVFKVLGMNKTNFRSLQDAISQNSKGYKVSFFKARAYNAPIYKGNNAAGYVVSNAEDVLKWLQFQMGYINSPLFKVAQSTHERDKTVALHDMSSYGKGWQINLDGTGEIYHNGLNPNFSSYIVFRPKEKLAVAVLANSNSNYTPYIGDKLMKIIAGEKMEEYQPNDGGDKTYSVVSGAIILYVLIVLGFLTRLILDIINKKRTFKWISNKDLLKIGGAFLLITPFLYALYILPEVIFQFNWEAILVWMPVSFKAVIYSILSAIVVSYIAYFFSLIFPEKDILKQKAPMILLMTALSGIANVLVIVMVTAVIGSDINMGYLFFYFGLIIGVYLLGRRFVQISLTKITRGVVYDLRIKLIDKIFSTSYEKFEGIDRGRVYTALNDDVNTIGGSINEIIMLITSFITAVGAFVYLASIAFWATILAIFIIVSISAVYYLVSQKVNVYYEEARDSRDGFMRLVNGLIDGYKEISLHRNKKIEYKADVAISAAEYRDKMTTADVKFTDAFMIGESLLVVLLGFVSISMTALFPNVKSYTVMSFVVVFLYLIGPVNAILNSIPDLMNLKIAWNRVQNFIKEIPENLNLNIIPAKIEAEKYILEAKDIVYEYPSVEEKGKGFKVGPVNLKINSGEVFFIIGGNGSGKTTLAKMLTGLYKAHKGEILINGKRQKNYQLSEYFSTVFNPAYLFDKLYNVNSNSKEEEIEKYLKILDLNHKVEILDGKYSTIHLSAGQRKRLALLQCYLENSPIYLFDEWAADQDPEYRNFFYRTLLPEMKALGKIVIAITHDDHYFDVADKIIKLDRGKVELIEKSVFASINF